MFCRVLYFSLANLTHEGLDLAMRKGLDASYGLFSVAGVACFVVVPVLDAMEPSVVGPRLVRVVRIASCAHACKEHAPATLLQLAILGALIKGYLIPRCRVNPAGCRKLFHEYKIVVNVQLATDTSNSTNGTHGVHVEERTMFSSLDIMSSCDTIIAVVCLQMYAHRCMPMVLCCTCMLVCAAASSAQFFHRRLQMWCRSHFNFQSFIAKYLAAQTHAQ